MLFTLSTTHQPATDLGFLLHKHPQRGHEISTPHGKAVLFYPEASYERCTFAMTLLIDPITLVRGTAASEGGLLDQYVNDRPYAVSSFLTVAMGRALGTAFAGRCKERPELAETPLPFEILLTPLPVRGAEDLPQHLFAPLGYTVECQTYPLLDNKADWGTSTYITLKLNITARLQTVLEHLFVLIPVLDNHKHYYIGRDELEKLLRKGESWLQTHPAKALIADRYLRQRRQLVQEALARLADEPISAEQESTDSHGDRAESLLEKPLKVHETRLETITQPLLERGAKRVLDLGCGEGRLLSRLCKENQFQYLTGVDVSSRALEMAHKRLRLDNLLPEQRERLQLLQGALTYRDQRFAGFDAIALVEVIEHLEPDRLPALERVVFEFARPKTVLVTTPNREYNALIPALATGKLRHSDHRFEWTRAEFTAWCEQIAQNFAYQVKVEPLGPLDPVHGSMSQLGIFTL